MDISVVIVAFKSDHILDDLISSIPKSFEIIVVENSLETVTKNKIESKFSNTEVLIPDENLGYSGGVNLGIKQSKNNFVLVLVADVNFSAEMIQNLKKCIEKFDDFALLAPVYENDDVHKNLNQIDSDRMYHSIASYETLCELDKENLIKFKLIYKRLDPKSNCLKSERKFLAIVTKS